MEKLTGIQAISFDGDGTLWDFEKVMRHSLRCVLKELERIDPSTALLLDIETMITIRDSVANELKGEVTSLEEIRRKAFEQTLREIGRPDNALASHLNNVYLTHRFEDIELFDDVPPTLTALKEKYTLGLLSNGNSYPERCGLEDIFQFVIFSQDYGIGKPDPRIFKITAEKAGCAGNELLHVGDSIHDDVRGALNAGISCLWLNRGQKGEDNAINREISSLTELLQILE